MILGSGLSGPIPDFKTEILPIFKQHCLDCHGNGNREGELDLESLAGVRVGGHSGSPLLAEELDQSELYLRVTSTTAGYRMPKKGKPLSVDELQTLAAWIQATPLTDEARAGAGAELTADSDAIQSSDSQPVGSMFPWLDALTVGQRYQVISISIAIALLLVYLFVRAIQTRNKKRRENPDREQSQVRHAFGWVVRGLVGVSLCVALIGFGYYYFLASRLSQEVEGLSARVASLQPKKEIRKPIGRQHLPLPPFPMHPPRLGGRYYRGNDERDPSLFNGGFYRTATIDLHLVDTENQPLQWLDKASDELFVEITIDRAPEATRELFTDRVHEAVSLQHFSHEEKSEGEVSRFDVIEVEQRWRARIALPNVDSWQGGKTAGMIYMMYGFDHAVKSDSGAPAPRPHFGIRYEIEIEQGKIAQASTLWMGSMYTLGGRVMVPNNGQVLLDRWFDWRPIPAIEGEGSSDPELLGLPEQLRSED